jgi:hypothetical protein
MVQVPVLVPVPTVVRPTVTLRLVLLRAHILHVRALLAHTLREVLRVHLGRRGRRGEDTRRTSSEGSRGTGDSTNSSDSSIGWGRKNREGRIGDNKSREEPKEQVPLIVVGETQRPCPPKYLAVHAQLHSPF